MKKLFSGISDLFRFLMQVSRTSVPMFLIFTFLVIFCLSIRSYKMPEKAVSKEVYMQRRTLEIIKENGGQKYIACTAAAVEDVILTAAHCINDLTRTVIKTHAGIVHVAYTAHIDVLNDIAVLKYYINKPTYSFKMAGKTPKVGSPITVMGHGGYVKYWLKHGRVTVGITPDAQLNRPRLMLDIMTMKGFSGSAVLNDNLEVVGLLSIAASIKYRNGSRRYLKLAASPAYSEVKRVIDLFEVTNEQ